MDHLSFRRVKKEQRDPVPEQNEDAADKQGVNASDLRCRKHACPDTFRLSCARVLARVGRHGPSESVKYTAAEHVDLLACRDRSHRGRSQGIDRRLQDDRSDGSDGVLEPHGEPHAEQHCALPAVWLHLPRLKAEHREFFLHVEDAQDP